jgi:DNA gyrase subunit B
VGASVVNALSEWLVAEVHKEGKVYRMEFSRGKITKEMEIVGACEDTGTIVSFRPDPEMFDTLVYDYETLHKRMREQAFLNAGLRITIADKRDEHGKSILGSLPTVPAVFGMTLANEAIRYILEKDE